MPRKSSIPPIPSIYQSRQDLEHPSHETIEAFKSVAEGLEWEKDLREKFLEIKNQLPGSVRLDQQ